MVFSTVQPSAAGFVSADYNAHGLNYNLLSYNKLKGLSVSQSVGLAFGLICGLAVLGGIVGHRVAKNRAQ
jgi:hypothetical protein